MGHCKSLLHLLSIIACLGLSDGAAPPSCDAQPLPAVHGLPEGSVTSEDLRLPYQLTGFPDEPTDTFAHIAVPSTMFASTYEVETEIGVDPNSTVQAGVALNVVDPASTQKADIVVVDTAKLRSPDCLTTSYLKAATASLDAGKTARHRCPRGSVQDVYRELGQRWLHLRVALVVGSPKYSIRVYFNGRFAAEVTAVGTSFPQFALVVRNGLNETAYFRNIYFRSLLKNTSSCEPGWDHNQNSAACYNVVHEWVDYDTAHHVCAHNYSASLLTVDDAVEMDFLNNLLFFNYEDHWTSATDFDYDGVFEWNNGTDAIGFSHWFAGTDNMHEDEGQCMYLLKNIYWDGWYMNNFQYDHYNCSLEKHFICEKPAIQCPAPYAVLHSRRDSGLVHIGSVVTYSCHVGYEFPDGTEVKSVVCGQDGVWSCQPSDCQLKLCPEMNHVTNANYSTSLHHYDVTLDITCLPGYIYPDGNLTKSMRCQDNRQWDYIPPNCEKVICPEVPIFPHMTYTHSGREYEDNVTMTCGTGYMFPDRVFSRTLECTHTANWSSVPEPCVELSCPDLGYEHVILSDPGRAKGVSAELRCEPGYEWLPPYNASRHWIRCEPHADWNDTVPDCAIRVCRALPAYFGLNLTSRDYGTEVELHCQPGDVFSNQASVQYSRCGVIGTWEPLALTCFKKLDLREFYLRPPVEAKDAVVIGTFQIVGMTIFFLIVLVMDLETLYRTRWYLKRNLRDFRRTLGEEKERIWKNEDSEDEFTPF